MGIEIIAEKIKMFFDPIERNIEKYHLACLDEAAGDKLMNENKFDEASKAYGDAAVKKIKIVGRRHIEYGRIAYKLSRAYLNAGHYDDAHTLAMHAAYVIRKRMGRYDKELLECVSHLASIAGQVGDYKSALMFNSRLCTRTKILFGEESIEYAIALDNYGMVFYKIKQFENALKLCLKANQIFTMSGEEDIHTSLSYNNLAVIYRVQKLYDEAFFYQSKACEIIKLILGDDNPKYATFLNNLALIYHNTDQFTLAIECYKQSLSIFEVWNLTSRIEYANTHSNLGETYLKIGNNEDALESFKQALSISYNCVGEDHPNTLANFANMAIVHDKLGNYKDAIAFSATVLSKGEDVINAVDSKTINELITIFDKHKEEGASEE